MKIAEILRTLKFQRHVYGASQFRSEEDNEPYQVWKLDTQQGSLVLKKTSPQERAVYEAFFADGGPVPKVYAFGEFEGELYMLMEHIPGASLCRCTQDRLRRTLDVLIASQEKYWESVAYGDIGYGFAKSFPNRQKRLPYMGDLADAYRAYLSEFEAVPRTLCNDDMLPMNVVANDERVVILDWEFGGILPYPCALARLLAFGEEDPQALFQMTGEERRFALDYYYANLVAQKGISRERFDRTMALFFFKEYSEWVYCAGLSGDYEMEYYQKYYAKAKELATELGF